MYKNRLYSHVQPDDCVDGKCVRYVCVCVGVVSCPQWVHGTTAIRAPDLHYCLKLHYCRFIAPPPLPPTPACLPSSPPFYKTSCTFSFHLFLSLFLLQYLLDTRPSSSSCISSFPARSPFNSLQRFFVFHLPPQPASTFKACSSCPPHLHLLVVPFLSFPITKPPPFTSSNIFVLLSILPLSSSRLFPDHHLLLFLAFGSFLHLPLLLLSLFIITYCIITFSRSKLGNV